MRSEPQGARTLVWALPISLATTFGITVVFSSSAYLDVSVQRVPGCTLWIHAQSLQLFCSRFPHSEICGSIDICSSPQLIAAYHVLHRLLVPRHPPYALFCLTSYMFSSVRTCGLVALLSQSIRLYISWIRLSSYHLGCLDILKLNIHSVCDFQGAKWRWRDSNS